MIERMDQVVVVDLEAATAFFAELGIELEGAKSALLFPRPRGIIVALAEQIS